MYLNLNDVMAPCKWQVEAVRHLLCGNCSNWPDFVKVQADNFSFDCRGCAKTKILDVEME